MILYHCSPTPGLRVLEPRVTPYFDKTRQLCLTELRPMALFYGIRHFEYTYGYTRAGELYYMEQFPGALAELYGGKSASLYLCGEREGMERTAIPHEVVTQSPVPVREEIVIPDLLTALREQERLDTVRLIPWERVDEADRRWIIDAERREILDRGLLDRPEEPMARYLRAKYPESWARAGEERERQASPRYHKE